MSDSSGWPKSGPASHYWSRFACWPPRASVQRALRWAAAAAKAGGAALGLAVVLSSASPEAVLGLLGVVLLLVGGTTWTAGSRSALPLRIGVSLATIILARLAAGPAAAALAALLLALGAWLRIRPAEVAGGLATFGLAVAVVGGGSLDLFLGFFLLGLTIMLLRFLVGRLRPHVSRGASLTDEKGEAMSLGPEN